MSKSWPWAMVVGMVLAGGPVSAGDEAAPPAEGAKVQCTFTDNSQLKLKNTATRGVLASGKTVQVTYKTGDGSVRTQDFRMDSDLLGGKDITVRVPVERAKGATCSAKIQ